MSVNLQSRVINLRRNLLALGAVVEQRVATVIEVIRDGDVELARQVRACAVSSVMPSRQRGETFRLRVEASR